MAIDPVTPPSTPPPQFKKAEPKRVARPNQDAATEKPVRKPAAAGANPLASRKSVLDQLSEGQDKLKAIERHLQTQSELEAVERSLANARQDLASLSAEQLAGALNQPSGEGLSYWQNLDVVEKARTINRLKEQVRDLELARSSLVESLAQQVQSGTYRVSGAEILLGMMTETL